MIYVHDVTRTPFIDENSQHIKVGHFHRYQQYEDCIWYSAQLFSIMQPKDKPLQFPSKSSSLSLLTAIKSEIIILIIPLDGFFGLGGL